MNLTKKLIEKLMTFFAPMDLGSYELCMMKHELSYEFFKSPWAPDEPQLSSL